MHADGLKQALQGKMYWDGDGCDGDGVRVERNLWGWDGHGENKLCPCSSLVQMPFRPSSAPMQSTCR